MLIGNKDFDIHKTHIMGILNVTPDSFSDGGNYNNVDRAVIHALDMIREGATIIDIGGESTRPGYTRISDNEEIDRVCPVIEKLKKETDIPISLDTYKSKVAAAGIKTGAHLINDIWGLKFDKEMAQIIAEANIPCCLMHNRTNAAYTSFMSDYLNDIKDSIEIALNAGIKSDNIILDPGVGFAKNHEQNLMVIKHLKELTALGYPVLLGVSRKSVIGLTLDLPKDERLEGTIATSVIGVLNNCMFLRVHDVQANYRAVKMTEAIMNI